MLNNTAPDSTSPSWRLKLRNDLHLMRKVWHCGMGVFMAGVLGLGTPKVVCVLMLITGLVFFLTAEICRLRFPQFNKYAIKVMGPVMRSHEVSTMSGTPFYVGSVLLSVAIFPKPIAVLSILFLAIGDPISSVFGIMWGDKSIRFSNGKSLIGTAAGMGICTVIAFIYLMLIQVPPLSSLFIALAGGFAGGGAEMIPLDIDDNFSIPVVSGLALWVAFLFFGV
jgi:dolichol kinase